MHWADLELVQRDPGLPGLATLLDEEAFLICVQSVYPELGALQASAEYVRYKPHTQALVKYQIQTEQGSVLAYAKAHPLSSPQKTEKDVEFGFRVVGGISIGVFPLERKLKHLPELTDGQFRQELLPRVLPHHPELWSAQLHTLTYKPERRYVGRLVGEGAEAVLRVYTANSYSRYQSEHGLLSGPRLRLAKRLGQSDKHQMVVMEWLEGRLSREALGAPDFDASSFGQVGQALAELHHQRDPHLLTHADPQARLQTLANDLSFLIPHLSKRIHQLTQWLNRQLSKVDSPPCVIHGDFYDKQVLLGERVAFLDLDESAWGHPAFDLGLFLAHLERDALLGSLTRQRLEPVRAALLKGYGKVPTGLGAYTALGLLSLAPHPFRNRLPDWPQRIEQIVQRAEALAGYLQPTL